MKKPTPPDFSDIANQTLSDYQLSRRRLLQATAAVAGLSASGVLSYASPPSKSAGRMKRLVLVELDGGNDGLNTLIPYLQKRYYEARPKLALSKDVVLPLDNGLAMHPELSPLLPAWKAGEMNWALGVGYPQPNLSHFRSIDIWNTASGSEIELTKGWLANQFDPRHYKTEGLVLGGDFGPLSGSRHSLAIDNPEQFAKQAARMRPVSGTAVNPALAHILDVRQQIHAGLEDLNAVLAERNKNAKKVKGTPFYKQMHTLSEFIQHGTATPVWKTSLSGFDTHFYQPNRHKALMKDLAGSLALLRERLMESGDWDDTLVMTYSEFGRRPAENGSGGTDHGTSAPVLFMGGRVKGGFVGEQPRFPGSNEQNMDFSIDYRSLYRTVAQSWLELPQLTQKFKRFDLLNVLS